MSSETRSESTRSQHAASCSGITSPDQPGSKPEVKNVLFPSAQAAARRSRNFGLASG